MTVPFSSDTTAATAAPMLISLTSDRLAVTSCFLLCLRLGLSQLFLPGSNTTRGKLICYTMLRSTENAFRLELDKINAQDLRVETVAIQLP